MCPVWPRFAPLEKSGISVGENSLGLFWAVPGSAGLGCAGLRRAVPGPTAGSGWTGLGRAWRDWPNACGGRCPRLGASAWHFCVFGLWVFCVCWWAPAALLGVASSDAVKQGSAGLGWLDQCCLCCGLGWAAPGGLAAWPWLGRAGLSWAVPRTQPSTYPLEKVYVPCLAPLCSVGEISDLRWREFVGAVLGCVVPGSAGLGCAGLCLAVPGPTAGSGWTGLGRAWHDLPRQVGLGVLVWLPILGSSVFRFWFSVYVGGLLLRSSTLPVQML